MNKTQRSIDLAIRLVAIAGLATWCFVVVRPFLSIVLWATILAIGLYPPFLWLKRVLGQRATLSAVLLALLGISIIVGPLAFLGIVVFGDIQNLYATVAAGPFMIPEPPPGLESIPIIGATIADLWRSAATDLGSLLARLKPQLEALAKILLDLSANTGITIFQLLLSMIVAAGFMLNAAALRLRIAKVVRKLAPVQAEDLLKLSTSTIQNVIRGVIGVAVVQTALVSVGLLLANIPGAGLLVLLCFVLILVQLGPTLVVVPSIIYAWMTMGTLWALIFTIWMVAAGTVDNILKPIWMGKGLPVPILIVFLGVIGGTLTNGVLGLFVGPVVLALGYDLLRIWVQIEPVEAIAPSSTT